MSDKLKDFIRDHREEFDVHEPGDLWSGIDHGMQQHSSFINSKNIQHMIKYGFGASALIAGTFLVLTTQKEKKPALFTEQVIPKQTTISKSPEAGTVLPGAVLYTEIKKEPETEAMGPEPVFSQQVIDTVSAPEQPEEEPASATSSRPNSSGAVLYTTQTPQKKNDDSLTESSLQRIDTLFKGVKKLEVNSDFCHITVKAHAGNDVTVKGEVGGATGDVFVFGRKSYANKVSTCRFEKKDSLLKVWIEPKHLKGRRLVKEEENKTAYLNFEVPSKIQVTVHNSSGNIAVSGIETGKVELKAGFGHIKAVDIRSELIINSSSGNVDVMNLVGNLRCETSFGHQTLAEIKGDAWLRSSSGNISVKQLKGNINAKSSFGHQRFEFVTGDVTAVASSGNLVIKELKGKADTKTSFGWQQYTHVEGNINSHASSGNIEIDGAEGNLVIGTSFGNISGKNVRLSSSSEFNTSSGSIHMNFLNSMNELRFDLACSSGNILVEKDDVKNRSSDNLLMGKGSIVVKGISSFGNQTYR